ncbi:E3 ubiquitin-protein ligase BRE1-like 2 [Zostera marina]|uniref:E3 ubiquitin protein ligase n=1 Tax=Zostera marina TaxID=29655 RepID=A0A0K9PWB8_ZOSMR|nr:E3 ubiquitin-protein ligase BRE1-like 2 [Zostera marina]
MRNGGNADEPEKKKKKENIDLAPMAKSSLQSAESGLVDAAALQLQNQKLVQQLEAKKQQVHALEKEFNDLKDRQNIYDEKLITMNKLWNQLVDDIIIFESLLGEDSNILQALDHEDDLRDSIHSCPPEEMFLHRLLSDSSEMIESNNAATYIQQALESRCMSTRNLMKHFENTANAQKAKIESLAMVIKGKPFLEDARTQLHNIDNSLREKVNNLRESVEFMNHKHKKYEVDIKMYIDNHLRDKSAIKHLSGELEESMAELEESRRKLINLKIEKHGFSRIHGSVLNVVNGDYSPNKPVEKTRGLQELKISIEEAKILAASRLSELQETKEDNEVLSKQLEDIQNDLKDEKYVISSKPYLILKDHLQHFNVEHERYKELVESAQTERNNILRKEKELTAKEESFDAAIAAFSSSTTDAQIKEMKLQLENITVDRNNLEMKFEEAVEDAARKDIKDEINVMASALSKEIEMMEAQLNRCKELACEAIFLRDESRSLTVLLNEKTIEHKRLSENCVEQAKEIQIFKQLTEKLEVDTNELSAYLDLYGKPGFELRPISEIKKSEHRALVQAEILRNAFDEHSLELRVRAANEAREGCQQRLFTFEAEVADLMDKLDISERNVLELKEAIQVKDAEADSYILEIEAIGQAYEDMQMQNQRLLQQVADRDDCNIKLVSETVSMKQSHSSLFVEKRSVTDKLQQIITSLEYFRSKIIRGKEQMKTLQSQVQKVFSDNRHVATNMDKEKRELNLSEKDLKWISSSIESYEKEFKLGQREITNMETDFDGERVEGKQFEDELTELKNEVDEMSAEKREAAIQKFQEEIKECKAILKCGVCFDRPKEVVITKCFHLFCSKCIRRNLEIRHRRCPGCGSAFGQNDVRQVNI